MTIDKLLGKSAAELEAMSDVELETYFKPYLPITRPELQLPREEKKNKYMSSNGRTVNTKMSKKHLAEQILMEALGRRIKL